MYVCMYVCIFVVLHDIPLNFGLNNPLISLNMTVYDSICIMIKYYVIYDKVYYTSIYI